ncbi:MAG TPA: alpha/beta fold hydrolase, partial [Pyrinomonadaceae bacterium]|nr:alpha/beta fold hydrolase [Pyrinomonadaceae bacterium]
SHIYTRTGDYTEAAHVNIDAIAADREYIAKTGAQGLYTMMYYNHNIHFLAAANAMKGRYADSIKSARELEANVKPHVKAMPMLEMFVPYPKVTIVRFARWDEALNEPKPEPELKITTGFWHFARGSAYAATNQIAKADAELTALQALIKTIPADAPLGNSGAVNVLRVADLALAGKIAYARGDKQAAFDLLNKAVAAEDATSYNEPSDWDLPVREFLGGALLASGDYATAESVFRAEIEKHPRNGRALFGLAESLRKQGKNSSAQMVQHEFEIAWQSADTKLSVESLIGTQPKAASVNRPTIYRPATDVQFANVLLKTGVRLRYAHQGDAGGEPIILLHGYTDSWLSYSTVLPLLDKKYRVYILDQRGHGESDRPVGGYALQQFADDVLAFMDTMNIKQATLVGHSMGSFVAQHVAVAAPDRVKRLVLAGSATTIRNAAVTDIQREVNALKDPVPEKFVRDFQLSTMSQPLADEFVTAVVTESMKLPARVWREVMAEMLSPEAQVELKKIKVPTLILWGDKETVFPRSEQDLLLAALPNARLKVYEDTGHAMHWERPERFAKDLQEFMN